MNVIVRNGLSVMTSQATTMLVALVVLVVVPDYLGEVDFGRYAFSLVFVGLFGIVGTFGTGMYLTKVVARDPTLVGSYIYSTLALKLLMAMVLAAAALGLAAVLGFDSETMLLVVAACMTMTITLLNETVVAALFGLERMAGPSAWGVVGQLVAATLGITAVSMGASVVGYAFVIVPAALIPLTANFGALRPRLERSGGVNVQVWRTVLAGGFPFFILTGISIVYGSIDMVMLRPLAGDATVGWYALAYRWIALPVLFASTAMAALFPSLSVHGVDEDDRFCRLTNRALMFVAFIGFPAAAGIALVAGDVIRMAYGGQFLETIPLMRILAFGVPIIVIDTVLGMAMMASDRQKQWMLIGGAAAILNPILNLWAIPYTVDRYGNGAIGAATATVVTELVMLAGAVYFLPSGVMDRPTKAFMARCIAATSTMVLVVVVLGDLPLAGTVVIGALVYAVGAVIFRVATRAEYEWFRAQLSSRSAPPPSSPPTAESPFPTSTPVE